MTVNYFSVPLQTKWETPIHWMYGKFPQHENVEAIPRLVYGSKINYETTPITNALATDVDYLERRKLNFYLLSISLVLDPVPE